MKTAEFYYHLPPELIAQYPPRRRREARLLVLDREKQSIVDSHFRCLSEFINADYFLVLNDSKVFKARIQGHRSSGGKVEIFLVRRLKGSIWIALLRPSGRIKKNERIFLDTHNFVTVLDDPGTAERLISFSTLRQEQFALARYGQVPLPPYIRREANRNDIARYQTVFARKNGSVAAPTAGLHFDKQNLRELAKAGISCEKITLHVGPGTFKPVTAENLEEHVVDPEFALVSSSTAKAINRRKNKGQKLLAVGTTSVRTLEAAADAKGRVSSWSGMVDLFIYPPYHFKMVDAMLTNFHLPNSSLLMLVSAFCGKEFLFSAYRHAVSEKYRFYSYGDCMLII